MCVQRLKDSNGYKSSHNGSKAAQEESNEGERSRSRRRNKSHYFDVSVGGERRWRLGCCWSGTVLHNSASQSSAEQTLLYFCFHALDLAARRGVIDMQASAGQLDEPGPELGAEHNGPAVPTKLV